MNFYLYPNILSGVFGNVLRIKHIMSNFVKQVGNNNQWCISLCGIPQLAAGQLSSTILRNEETTQGKKKIECFFMWSCLSAGNKNNRKVTEGQLNCGLWLWSLFRCRHSIKFYINLYLQLVVHCNQISMSYPSGELSGSQLKGLGE